MYSRLLIVTLFFFSAVVETSAQKHANRRIQEALDSMHNITASVRTFEEFGTKMIGSSALNASARWLDTFYRNLGYEVQWDTFSYSGHELYNIVIDKTEHISGAPWLLILAHYDTRNGPGANDNGSGVATCMEIGRVLSHLSVMRLNVRIIHFSSEEFGLAGSYHYIQNTLTERPEQVKLVFNLDQLGGSRSAENNHLIYCERDPVSPGSVDLTDTLAMIVRSYSQLQPVISTAFASDYIPFQQSDYTINGLYQYSDYPFYHTINDRVENMDTFWLQEAAKAALAYVLYLAAPFEWTLSMPVQPEFIHSSKVYYQSTLSNLIVEGEWQSAELWDFSGKLLERMLKESSSIPVGSFSPGPYLLKLHRTDGSTEFYRWMKF